MMHEMRVPFNHVDTPDALWWSEGGERVWVEGDKLMMFADEPTVKGRGVATAFCKHVLPADFSLDIEAHVISSSTNANNINLFFGYSDPAGRNLYDTRSERADASYSHYHPLNGNIITFLNGIDAPDIHAEDGGLTARVRIRHCPGFQLLSETRAGRCRQGETYHLNLKKRGGEIIFCVNGTELLRTIDTQSIQGGLFGLRTYQTRLWWRNIRIQF
jgi:hypothetical protein